MKKKLIPLAIIMMAALSGCDNNSSMKNEQPTAVPVHTLTLQSQQITPYVTFIGRTTAANHVDIIPHVEGDITDIFFKDGQLVKKNQPLYEIDKRPYEAKVKSAEANLLKAQSTLSIKKRNSERAKRLIKSNSISQIEFDTTITDYQTAQASVKEAEANLLQAQIDLGYTTIKAPFDGRVGFSQYKVGDRVTAVIKNRLVSLSQIDPIRFDFDVNEKLYRRIRSVIDTVRSENKKVNAKITLTMSNGEQFNNSGKIHAVDNRIDPETGSIHVQATFENPDYNLMPGEFGHLTIKMQGQTIDGLLIPVSAIQEDQAGSYVMLVDENQKVVPTYLELGQKFGSDVSVLSGLKPNQTIVTNGLQKIRPGSEVISTSDTQN